jgi:hypothetical protein
MLNLNTDIVGQVPLAIPDVESAHPFLLALERLELLEVSLTNRIEDLRAVRQGMLSSLLSGARAIPDSYDRFLPDENLDSANLEPATV